MMHSWLRVGNAGIHVVSLQRIVTQCQMQGWVQGREECACLACAHGEMDAGEKLGEAGWGTLMQARQSRRCLGLSDD